MQGHALQILRGSAPGRTVAMLYAVLFLIVGVAHTAAHFDVRTPVLAIQADLGPSGDSSDALKDAGLTVTHCHACPNTALPMPPAPGAPGFFTVDFARERLQYVQSCAAGINTPPPISSI